MAISETLAELRRTIDDLDTINAEKSRLEERRASLELAVKREMESSGQTEDGDSVKASGLTVTIRRKIAVKYTPEKWSAVVRWAVENQYDYIVQRRLSDAKVLELIDLGVVLPDGLELEPYTRLDVRRVNAGGSSPA